MNDLMTKLKNSLPNKYKPVSINEMIMDDKRKLKFKEILETGVIPNSMMFYGVQGTGKSTLANILINNMKNYEFKIVNGSNENGVSHVREIFEPYLTSASVKKRILFINEIPMITVNAQQAMLDLMDNAKEIGNFVLACGNTLNNLTPQFRSRFQIFKFNELNESEITEYIKNILSNENIKYNENQLQNVITNLKPDIRNILSFIDQNTIDNELVITESFGSVDRDIGLYLLVKTMMSETKNETDFLRHFDIITKYIKENPEEINYMEVSKKLFLDSSVQPAHKVKINKYMVMDKNSPSSMVNFFAMLSDLYYG